MYFSSTIRTKFCLHFSALVFRRHFFALIEGSHTKAYACALSIVTGIPLVRLYGSKRPFDQCDKAVQMSAGYRDYAHATLDIVNEFQWKRVASIYDGKPFDLSKDSRFVFLRELRRKREREKKGDRITNIYFFSKSLLLSGRQIE